MLEIICRPHWEIKRINGRQDYVTNKHVNIGVTAANIGVRPLQ